LALPAERFLSPREVESRLRISRKTLANWRSDPAQPGPRYRRYGNKILYPESGLTEWEAAHEFRSTQDYDRGQEVVSGADRRPALAELEAKIESLKKKLVTAEEAMFAILSSPSTARSKRRR